MQLICIFTIHDQLDSMLHVIHDSYVLPFQRIFVLSITDSEELICSFNIEKNQDRTVVPGAMLVHRKKETNTLYTINSLNALIKLENNGILNTNYVIDWTKFQNSFLVTSNNTLKILKTDIHKVVKLP